MKKSLIHNAGIYTIANVLNAAIPFFLLRLLTIHLDPKGYGIVSMFSLVISVLNPIIGISTAGAITKQFFVLGINEFKTYVGNCVFIMLVTAGITFLSFCIFTNFFYNVTDIPFIWLIAALGVSSSQYLITIVLTIWQVEEKPIFFGLLQLCVSIINIFATIYLVVELERGWQGRLSGWLIGSAVGGTLSMILLARNNYLTILFNKIYIKHALKFSLPLVPHAIGSLIIGLSDRLIIKNVIGLSQTGIYTVAFQLGSILTVLMTAFNNAFVPWLFTNLNKRDPSVNRGIVGLTYSVFCVLVVFVFIGCFLNEFLFQYIVGVNFSNAKYYIPYLLVGFAFNGMYLLVTNYIFYAEKTKFLAKNTFLVAIINLPVCYMLTVHFSLLGTSMSIIISYFSLFISTWYTASKVYPMPWGKPVFKELMWKK